MDINFFEKQLLVKEFSKKNLDALINSRLLIIGAGAICHPALIYLSSSGVGEIIVADYDKIEKSNLHRQFIFRKEDINKYKVDVLKERVESKYAHTKIKPLKKMIDAKLLYSLIDKVDIVIDASDNFETRYLVNDIAFEKKKILVSGACIDFTSQVIAFLNDGEGPCYECLFPRKYYLDETNCSISGIIPPVAGITGTYLASLTLSILINQNNKSLYNKLINFNLSENKILKSQLSKNTDCEVCS